MTQLTIQQLRAYAAFGGDLDGWSRSAEASLEQSSGDNWHIVDELLMGFTVEAQGMASTAFRNQLHERILTSVPNPQAREILMSLMNSMREK